LRISRTTLDRRERWGPPLLALCACALVASTWHVFSSIWDEPEHIAAGLALIERGQYLYDDQHPPLARMAAAIGPYLAGARLPAHASGDGSTSGEEPGRQILYHSMVGHDTLLTLARCGMLPFLALLIAALWQWTRREHGAASAWLCAGFLLTTPPILGHAGVAALDLPVTALCTLSFYLLLRWLQTPDLRHSLRLGLAAGLATATKLSAVPFIGCAGLVLGLAQVLLLRDASRPFRPGIRLRGLVLIVLVALLVVIAVYGPHFVYMTTPDLRPSKALDLLVGRRGALHDAGYRWAARIPVPLGVQEVALNILGVAWHNARGHLSYLLGRTGQMGWWYFYPVALAVKTPLPLLALGLGGLGFMGARGWRRRSLSLLAPPLCFITILAFSCAYSHINIGVRHVLVLYPLLAIGAAQASIALWSWSRAPALRIALLALLGWQAATLPAAYPDFLAWFNVTAGDHPERILVDSDLDWGQDLKRLSAELARRRVPEVAIAYLGTADLSLEQLPPFRMLVPGQPTTGWVAIDLKSRLERRAAYAWLDAATPVTRVGRSIDLYDIAPR